MGAEKVGFIDLSEYKKPERKKTKSGGESSSEKLSVPTEVYKKAQATIKENKIDERKFTDYGEEVNKDIAEAERLKEEFLLQETAELKELHKYAEILEAMLVDFFNSCEWLGEGANSMNTADFDDYKNKIDIITELINEKGFSKHLGLAIDASFSNDLDNKFSEIKNNIRNGKLSELKYYKSKDFNGRLRNIPRVVIGVSLDNIKELGDLWTKGDMEAIRNHPVQYQILDEIILQLETFEKYAYRVSQNDLGRTYKETGLILKEIRAVKQNSVEDTGERDHIFKNIIDKMASFR